MKFSRIPALVLVLASSGCQAENDVSFLQQSLEIHDNGTAEPSSRWFDWDSRFPQLAVSDYVRVWTALGENWWMAFMDGKFHSEGPHTLDYTEESIDESIGMDGAFMQHLEEEYERWKSPDQWLWKYRWTSESVAELNARLKGTDCAQSECNDMFDPPELNRRHATLTNAARTAPEIRSQLNESLSDYYAVVTNLREADRTTRLKEGMAALHVLYKDMCNQHPFSDANSRTRMIVFQTESVRLGGHPHAIWDFKEIYHDTLYPPAMKPFLHGDGFKGKADPTPYVNWESSLFEGWCAWEVIDATGHSPFESGERPNLYNSTSLSCITAVSE